MRLLNRKLIDKINQRTPLVTVGKLEFERASGCMRVFSMPTMQFEFDYDSILQEAKDAYLELKEYHNQDTLRNVVNKLVASTGPVSMQGHSQGKFIPRDQIGTMRGLKSLLGELKEYAGTQECSLFLLPMVDCQDLRDTLTQRLTSEIESETSTILAEAQEARKKGKLKLEKAQSLIERFIGLQSKVKTFESLIKTEMPEVRNHLVWAMDNIEEESDAAQSETGVVAFDLAIN